MKDFSIKGKDPDSGFLKYWEKKEVRDELFFSRPVSIERAQAVSASCCCFFVCVPCTDLAPDLRQTPSLFRCLLCR